MRQRFNDGRFWERVQSGELRAEEWDSRHPSLTAANEPYCTRSLFLSYLDQENNEVARVHQYLRPDGTIGASGRPDPKRLLADGVLYRLVKARNRVLGASAVPAEPTASIGYPSQADPEDIAEEDK